MHGDAGPDDAQRARIEDSGRNEVDGEPTLLVDHGMAGIGAAMPTNNQVRITGEQVDDLALPLVAPMAADDSRYRHSVKLARSGRARNAERGTIRVILTVILLVMLSRFDRPPPVGLLGVPVDGGFQPIPEAPLRLPTEVE